MLHNIFYAWPKLKYNIWVLWAIVIFPFSLPYITNSNNGFQFQYLMSSHCKMMRFYLNLLCGWECLKIWRVLEWVKVSCRAKLRTMSMVVNSIVLRAYHMRNHLWETSDFRYESVTIFMIFSNPSTHYLISRQELHKHKTHGLN